MFLALAAGLALPPVARTQPLPEETSRELKAKFSRGHDLFRAGEYRKALPVFQSILAVDPGARGSLFLSGMAHLQLMEFGQAAPLLARFLEREPDHVSGLIGGIQAHQATGDTVRVDSYRQRLFTLKKDEADPRLKIMLSYERETVALGGGRRLSILERFPGEVETAPFKALVIESRRTVRQLEWREPEGAADQALRQLHPEKAGQKAFVLGEILPPPDEGGMEDYRMHTVAWGALDYAQARAGFLKVLGAP